MKRQRFGVTFSGLLSQDLFLGCGIASLFPSLWGDGIELCWGVEALSPALLA